MNKAVAAFRPLVDFLATVLGPASEVVLHDFSDPAHAVVKIRNGYVSGRKVGAPATDFALKVLSGEAFAGETHTPVYVARSASGKPLRSASYFIREKDRVVGMLCVNTDTSAVENLVAAARAVAHIAPTLSDAYGAGAEGANSRGAYGTGAEGATSIGASATSAIGAANAGASSNAAASAPASSALPDSSRVTGHAAGASTAAASPADAAPSYASQATYGPHGSATMGMEHFATSAEELVATTIAQIAGEKGASVASFSPADRLDVVRRLNADGVFLLKGAVAHVADTLGISEPSVYRYLQKARRAG